MWKKSMIGGGRGRRTRTIARRSNQEDFRRAALWISSALLKNSRAYALRMISEVSVFGIGFRILLFGLLEFRAEPVLFLLGCLET
jgi:hypothetical protein